MALPHPRGFQTLPRVCPDPPTLPVTQPMPLLSVRLSIVLLLAAAGCTVLPGPPLAAIATPAVLVPGTITEATWERTVDVLHAFHFSIEKENRLDGTIQTGFLTGAGLLEPWHHDSVTLNDRIESSLQPIRRQVVVRLTPGQGGFQVAVEVTKQREDPREPSRHSPGAATFPENRPRPRDLDVVLEDATPPGWINLGRDPALERVLQTAIVSRLRY